MRERGSRIRDGSSFDVIQQEFACTIELFPTWTAGEIGSEILLAASREFGKMIEWLLTGE